MADNSQNTVAGTKGGAPLTTSNGNWFLNSLSGLANVGTQFAGVYSSFREADAVNRIEDAQQVTPPQQTTPSYQVSNAADFFSDPERVKTAAVYALLATFAIGAVVIIGKKV